MCYLGKSMRRPGQILREPLIRPRRIRVAGSAWRPLADNEVVDAVDVPAAFDVAIGYQARG